MGNCMNGTCRFAAQSEKDGHGRGTEEAIKVRRCLASSGVEEASSSAGGGKRKMVRLGDVVGRGCNGDLRSGSVRVTFLLRQEELNQILNDNGSGYSYVEQLLTAIRLRSRSFSQVRTSPRAMNCSWRPALESILEDN